MDKIKSLFRPGGDADDNIMYGTPEPKNTHAQGGSHDHEDVGPAMLQTDPASETGKKQGGVMKQILNPGGAKYDEERYGTTAHSDKPLSMPTTGTPTDTTTATSTQGSLAPGTTLSRMKERGMNDSTMSIKSGITGPYAGQADSSALGSELGGSGAGSSLGGALPDRTAQSQSHIGRDATLGAGAGALGAGALAHESTRESSSGLNDSSLGSSATGGQSHLGRDATLGTGAGALGSGALAQESTRGPSSSLNDSSLSGGVTGGQSHLGRDAGLGAGAGALGAGALAHETRDSSLGSHGTSGGLTGRDIPGDSAGYHRPDETPVEGYLHHTQGPHSTDIANILDPHVPGEFPTASGEDPHSSHLGRDAAIGGGAGLGAAGLGAAGYEASKHSHESSTIDPTPSSSSFNGGLERSSQGASSALPTTSATSRDELPTEGASHHYGRDTALAGGAGAAGLGAYEATKSHGQTLPSTSAAEISGSSPAYTSGQGYPSESTNISARDSVPTEQSQHHYGRDAALAGGAGAAGLGTYEATKSSGNTLPSTSSAQTSTTSPAFTGSQGLSSQGPSSTTRDALPTEQSSHHYGRDAALVGGAGAAGAGAYELGKDHNATGPASKTIGPHDSNLANIMDPRVKPDPEKLFKSGKSNVADEPAKEHHYGRDAAVAGGAGTVGLGAYEATKDRTSENTAPLAQEQAAASQHGHHEHNKLHKKDDPRGDKHEKELQKAREHEAAKASDKGEKKEGFLHKLLHPGNRDKSADHGMDAHEKALHEKNEHERAQGTVLASEPAHGLNQHELATHEKNETARAQESAVAYTGTHGMNEHELAMHEKNEHERALRGEPELSEPGRSSSMFPIDGTSRNNSALPGGESGIVVEPHTGLPMNVGKYGTGKGGIDGAQNISGAHEPIAEGSAAETDWNKIKKGNTLY